MIGSQDTYFDKLTCHTLFKEESDPKVVTFNEGHKFPRAISQEDYEVLKKFIKDQFLEKNGDLEGYDVETERYAFEVRWDKAK